MKKTYLQTVAGTSDLELARSDGSERFALYTGIDAVYGGWMLETSGEPVALNALEDAECEAMINQINAIISDASTPWEALTADDEKYVRGTLEAWGIPAESL